MKGIAGIITLLLIGLCLRVAGHDLVKKKKVFTGELKDASQVQVYLTYNSDKPEYFYARVLTPVCEEGICYNISIQLYWDLLGNFSKYELPADSPLTKFDHVPFTAKDHQKMHKVLQDKSSSLGIYDVEDLIDKSVKIQSKVVADAVTGATNISIKSAVVGGAVYSSYVLWHIVNGSMSEKMVRYTDSLMNTSLLQQMMMSDNYNYQYYALNKILDAEIQKHIPYLVRLVGHGHTYIPYFAIARLPESFWNSAEHQISLIKLLPNMELKLQNELLVHLTNHPVGKPALKALLNQLQALKGQQLKRVLEITDINKNNLDAEGNALLRPLVENTDMEISSKARSLLPDRSKLNRY